MVIKYQPEQGYFTTARSWSHTVLPHVLARKEFWIFFGLHLLVYVSHQFGFLEAAQDNQACIYMDWNQMKVISGITTFFEVFYTNQSFQRYTHLYSCTRLLLGNICSYTFQCRLHHVEEKPHKYARAATRYMLSSVVLFFGSIQDAKQSPEHMELWHILLEQGGLLLPAEKEFIEHGPRRLQPLALLHWSAKVTRQAHEVAAAQSNELKGLLDDLEKCFVLQMEIADAMDLPMPFGYFHLLNVMVVINLMLWAYAMGAVKSMFAPIVYFFASCIFMGMMELASQLADPFGHDDSDFPLLMWLMEVLDDAEVLTEYRNPEELLDEKSVCPRCVHVIMHKGPKEYVGQYILSAREVKNAPVWEKRTSPSAFLYSFHGKWCIADNLPEEEEEQLLVLDDCPPQSNGTVHPAFVCTKPHELMKDGVIPAKMPQDTGSSWQRWDGIKYVDWPVSICKVLWHESVSTEIAAPYIRHLEVRDELQKKLCLDVNSMQPSTSTTSLMLRTSEGVQPQPLTNNSMVNSDRSPQARSREIRANSGARRPSS